MLVEVAVNPSRRFFKAWKVGKNMLRVSMGEGL